MDYPCGEKSFLHRQAYSLLRRSRHYQLAKSLDCEVPFTRPSSLAEDASSSIDVVLHALAHFPEFEWVVLLQPTSPLRTSEDIDRAFALCSQSRLLLASRCTPRKKTLIGCIRSIIAVACNPSPQPPSEAKLSGFYTLNGALYLAKTAWLLEHKSFISPNTLAYPMPPERSIDLDTEGDFKKLTELLEMSSYVSLST